MSSLINLSHFQSGMRELVDFAETLLESQTDHLAVQKVQSHIMRASQDMAAALEVASGELKSVDDQSTKLVAEKKKMEDERDRQNQQLSDLRRQLASSKSLECRSINMVKAALKHLEVLNQQAAANMFNPYVALNGGCVPCCCCQVALNAAASVKKDAEETVRQLREEAFRHAKETSRLRMLVRQAEHDIAAAEKRNKSMPQQHSLASRQAEIIRFQDVLRKCVHFLGLLAGKVSVADTLCRDILVYEELEEVLGDILQHVYPLMGQGHAGGVMVLSSDDIRGLILRLRYAREGLRALTSREASNAISYFA